MTRAAAAQLDPGQVSGGMPDCHVSDGATACLSEGGSSEAGAGGWTRSHPAGGRRFRQTPHPLGTRSVAAHRYQALRRLLAAMSPKRGGHLTLSVTSKAGERVAATFSHPSVMRMLRGAVADLADLHGAYSRPAGSPWSIRKSAPWEVRRANQAALDLVVERRAAREFLQVAGAALVRLAPAELAALLGTLPAAQAA